MRVNREEFLNSLEAVAAGLSPREIIEQSSCFIFKDGRISTYNDEVACSTETKLKIEGAVIAGPLLEILKKLAEEEIEIEAKEKQLSIKGKGRRVGIRMDAEILLPIETVEAPGKWRPLHEDFNEAVSVCLECAGRDDSQFMLTCLHIHPDHIEACDNFQMARYPIKTKIKDEMLVRRDSIKHVVALDMTEIAESAKWLHFRNPAGLVLSCRRYLEEYQDLSNILDVGGKPATLPKGLAEAAEKAEIFSSENAENNRVRIDIKEGKIRVKGEGASGWYSEIKKAKYEGPPLSFCISPKLLAEITRKHNDCRIQRDRLAVDSGRFQYVSCLEGVDD